MKVTKSIAFCQTTRSLYFICCPQILNSSSQILNGNRRLDRRMRVISFQREVFEPEAKDVLYAWIDVHHRQRARFTRQLLACLFHVVRISVCIAEGMHEVARLQAAHLRHHQCEQRVGGYIERYAEEDIGAALIELAG